MYILQTYMLQPLQVHYTFILNTYTLKAISDIYLECICCVFTYVNMFYIAADTKLKYNIHKGP